MKTIKSLLTAIVLLTCANNQVEAQGFMIYKGGASQYYASTDIDSIIFVKDTPEKIVPQHLQYVDLGLPSGTRWGTCNIGAGSPEQHGKYFAWGELSEKMEYSYSNYSVARYGDSKKRLAQSEDVAYLTLGKNWKIPTRNQFRDVLKIN